MEPPDFEAKNFTVEPASSAYPLCEEWRDGSEGSVFQLANIFFFLGFMGGSGFYGLLYLFTLLTLGFLCSTVWAWSEPCTTDPFLWSLALSGVTLSADNPCRYVAWRRKKLYLLFAKHRYIAKIFALVVRNDIAEKLYSLNDKAFDRAGHRYDLRLPSYCHIPGPN
ncbi:popeye domain-containing protein 3 isoform X3 [Stegastes partitus]|uniref:Popeye domain-containing protein 3 isoform X3 n=1 Tax=Stegastes partitus TaxID=144197 RepID=A0A9Y4KEZ2_9TELE|nr:PREDICTED: popeye domain-containing protein 3 isoform X3 [Stegastes partitus]